MLTGNLQACAQGVVSNIAFMKIYLFNIQCGSDARLPMCGAVMHNCTFDNYESNMPYTTKRIRKK